MILRVLGVLLLLGALFCSLVAFSAAGGVHGFNEFRASRLFDGDASYWTGGVVCLSVIGIYLLTRKKR